jgi:aldehyde dehydrogenase (NAD+)
MKKDGHWSTFINSAALRVKYSEAFFYLCKKTIMDTSFLKRLGVESVNPGTWYGRQSASTDTEIDSHTPVDGSLIGQLTVTGAAFQSWRATPAPQRGEIVRQYGVLLRKHKEDLGRLVSYEMGKSLQEGWGEVQEMIDICDFALGQSRMLYGMTTHSERPQHRMYEQWHPLGVVGIISAFNFPVAVWAWNAMIALVCGNVCVWKPSEKSSLCAIACQKLFNQVAEENDLPDGLCNVIVGDYKVGEMMTADTRVALISATGSTAMGKKVGTKVAERLGKTILEQCYDHHAFRKYGSRADGRRFRCRGYGRPAMHQHAATYYPRFYI